MRAKTYPLRTLLLTVSGWVHRHQTDVVRYLVEENRVLKEQLGGRALRLNDDHRRRLAARARTLGRDTLERIATIVTPVWLPKTPHVPANALLARRERPYSIASVEPSRTRGMIPRCQDSASSSFSSAF